MERIITNIQVVFETAGKKKKRKKQGHNERLIND